MKTITSLVLIINIFILANSSFAQSNCNVGQINGDNIISGSGTIVKKYFVTSNGKHIWTLPLGANQVLDGNNDDDSIYVSFDPTFVSGFLVVRRNGQSCIGVYEKAFVMRDNSVITTPVTFSANRTNVLCENGSNGSITINAYGGNGNFQYSINGGQTYSLNNFFNGLDVGSYDVQVKDSDGSSASQTQNLSISEPPALVAASLVGTILCNGGSTTIAIAANGGTAPYSGVGSFVASAGNHTYTVVDAKGCVANTSINISEPPLLVAASSAGSILCNGGSTTVAITANGGTAPYSGAGSFVASAGSHTYTVLDAKGCVANTSINISEPSLLVAASSAGTILCNGGSTTVTINANGGTAPYSGAGSFVASAGSHTYTVTDAKGCVASTSINISEPSLLVAESSAGIILCNGGSTTVAIAANGGTAPYSGAGSFTASAGNHVYTVIDGNGCTANTSINVSEPPLLNATSSAGTILCNGGSTTISIAADGGTAPYSGVGSFIVYAGNYAYTVTDANGCDANTSINVSEPILLKASIANLSTSNLNTCAFGLAANFVLGYGNSPTSGALNALAEGGTGAYSYSWSPSSNLSNVSVSNPIFTPSPLVGCAKYAYELKLTDANGCIASSSTEIKVVNVAAESNTKKVKICHKNGNNSLIEVSINAAPAHLAHGDCLGSCSSNCDINQKMLNEKDEVVTLEEPDIFPNPNDGKFFIEFVPSDANAPIDIFIQDILGRQIYSAKFMDQDKHRLIDLNNINGLTEGVYFVKIINGTDKFTKKINIIK